MLINARNLASMVPPPPLADIEQGRWIESCSSHLDRQRVVKSRAEIDQIRTACAASGHAFAKLLPRCHAIVARDGAISEGVIEHILLEEMVATPAHGMQDYFYPPVVAGGGRGCTLHYVANRDIVRCAWHRAQRTVPFHSCTR